MNKTLNILLAQSSNRCSLIKRSFQNLNHYDYNIIEAGSIEKTNRLLLRNNLDMLILDCDLHGTNELKPYFYIKNKFPSLPIVILTDDNKNKIDDLLDKGICDYLVKENFSENELLKTVINALERSKINQQVLDSKSFFNSAFNSLSSSIAILDCKGKIIYVNNTWRTLALKNNLNLAADGVGENYIEMSRKSDDAEGIGKKVADAIEDIIEFKRDNAEYTYKCGTKESVSYFKLILTRFLQNGKVRVVATHEDITEQKKAEEALKTTDKVFQHSINMLCIADFDGYLQVVNPAWTRILGYSEEELLSKPWIEFVHPEDRSKIKEARSKFINGQEVYSFENRYICKDGSVKWLSWNSFPYKEDKILFGVARDITENKRIEAELIQSKKDAEKSDRLKSEFLSQMSHEIRTPLNSLLGLASLIKMELGDSITTDLEDSFQDIDFAGRRIFRTIELLIKISEVHTNNYEPVFEVNSLTSVLEELVTIYKSQAEKKNLNLEFINDAGSTLCNFDQYSVHEIFSNIIDNAIKYTNEGSVKVHLEDKKDGKLKVSIRDTGIGISEEYINNIFQPFSQETSGYTRKYDGNGLGLALVKEYCDLNNAEVKIESKKNVGSNFIIIFNKK